MAANELALKLGLPAVGISTDPAKTAVEEFLGKLGCAMPEIGIKNLKVEIALAYDPAKAVKNSFCEVRQHVLMGGYFGKKNI